MLMQRMVPRRVKNEVPDTLFLLEHPHTITLGRRGKHSDILLNPQMAKALDVQVIETGRGGEVTYHGPGQIVGYPIFNLNPDRRDAHRYVRDLEEVLIRTLADFGIDGARMKGFTGVWVGRNKIAAIGVRLSRWVASHGFALNVHTNLDGFRWIIPCGITDKGVTSLANEMDNPPTIAEVEARIQVHFQAVFDIDLTPRTDLRRSIQMHLVRRRPTGWEALVIRRVPREGGFWQPVTGHIEAGESPIEAARREALEETGLVGDAVHDLDYSHRFMIDPDLIPKMPVPTIYEEYAFWSEVVGDVNLDPTTHDKARWLPLAQAAALMRWSGNRRGVELVERALRQKR